MVDIAIMASGTGTNAINLIQHSTKYQNIRISCVIKDTPTSTFDELLKQTFPDIPLYQVIPNYRLEGFSQKHEHEGRILQILKDLKIDWILLAGYMRMISPYLLAYYKDRIVNIHPSLLPQYPGMDAYKKAYFDNRSTSGVTVHLVDEGMDSGKIIFQKAFERYENDTMEDFIHRGKMTEWELYPEVLKKLNVNPEALIGV